MRKRFWMPMALGFVASIGLSFSPPAEAISLLSISEKQEIDIGRQAARDIESKYRVSRDRRLNSMVQDIGHDMARVSNRPNLPWQFKVLDDPMVNAVALPGGIIYVFRGLIDQVRGDRDMLAGVLAHEVAHVSAKHHTEMMEKQMTGNLLIGLLTKGKTRDIAGLFSNIYALKFSRNDEYESDKLGIRFATRAGYDPYGLPEFLQVLERSGGRGAPIWLSSHPSTGERVRRARQYASEARRSGGTTTSSATRSNVRYGSSNRDDRDDRYLRDNRKYRRDGRYTIILGAPVPRR
ncbi:MAG: M48 family metalloprotease [Armatimonadetes bacterium]|nr:M48 family metalloprotease [Armatimonadota bacterium]